MYKALGLILHTKIRKNLFPYRIASARIKHLEINQGGQYPKNYKTWITRFNTVKMILEPKVIYNAIPIKILAFFFRNRIP
jgi:hypothetical protein